MPRRRKVSALLGSDPDYARELGTGGALIPENKAQQPKSAHISPARKPQATADAPDALVERTAVHLFACPKATHEQGLNQLSALGIASRDVIRLAGRQTSAKFVPGSTFVPPSDTGLMHNRYAYKTTRLYDAALLQALREAADPLGLMSHAALLRGQFEPLFWRNLETVIEELLGKTR